MESQDQLRDGLSELAQRFSVEPAPVRKKLAEMLVADPPGFRAAALRTLPAIDDTSSRRCLLDLMLKADLLPACDPGLMEIEEEVAVTRELLDLEPLLDMKLAQRLSTATIQSVSDETIQRVLVLLNSIPENARVLPMLVKLLRHPNPNVRSKAVLVIGRIGQAPQVMGGLLSESDPRIRANAIEALWGMDSTKARMVLREAASDANNRVVGNALLGLYRLGETSAIPGILQMAAHAGAEFRTTAVWVMEQTGSPRFLPALAQMVRESDPKARAGVFRAITKLKRAATAMAGLPRLRVHLTGVSCPAEGRHAVRAAIATQEGRPISRLPATALVLWEDSRVVAEYSVRQLERPDSLALALVLPLGDAGDRALATLTPLKRQLDRWQDCRYFDASTPMALDQAFAFLQGASSDRHMIFVAPRAGEPQEVARSEQALERARNSAVSLQIVPGSLEDDPGQVANACEKAYLMLLCGCEITSQGAGEPAEVKLEVVTAQSYGADVLKPAIPG